MASFKIEFKRSAERDLRRISRRLIPNILMKIEALADNPFPKQSVKLSTAETVYRLRVGSYRVIYEVDASKKVIVICRIRHRREAYRTF
jgi:mRNA interferase RelE/StbE